MTPAGGGRVGYDGLTDLEAECWQEEGDQTCLRSGHGTSGSASELGWANIGPRLRPAAAPEGDGDHDAEHDDRGGDPLDKGELDPCDLGEREAWL